MGEYELIHNIHLWESGLEGIPEMVWVEDGFVLKLERMLMNMIASMSTWPFFALRVSREEDGSGTLLAVAPQEDEDGNSISISLRGDPLRNVRVSCKLGYVCADLHPVPHAVWQGRVVALVNPSVTAAIELGNNGATVQMFMREAEKDSEDDPARGNAEPFLVIRGMRGSPQGRIFLSRAACPELIQSVVAVSYRTESPATENLLVAIAAFRISGYIKHARWIS